ncbi:MAG TPA: zf-HC2 domain-containing protein, partial [Myxococcaceae bacterium]|nr:zf-HC2 domain-containing protein [Myxococcaceae bacterium]
MPALCNQIEPFADGELGPDEAEVFRDHLANCVACQTELNNLLILARLGARYVEKKDVTGGDDVRETPRLLAKEEPGGVPLPRRRVAHRAVPRSVSAGLLAAACALLIGGGAWMASRKGEPDVTELAWNPGGRTLTTPRLSDPRADRYRPVAQQMMGSETGAELPLQALAKLGQEKDFRGLAAAYLAWNKPDDALATLSKLDPADADVQSDRAAVLLSLGRSSEALPLLDQVLASRSDHPQARWNRALAYEALGMPLSAARDYQALSKPRSADDGWAREAAERAAKLTQTERELEGRWKTTKALGEALAREGRLPEGASVSNSPILRLYFYEAVRTRVSRDEVLALKPLGRQLDLDAGGDVLQRYVERIAARDFGRRAPLARRYAEAAAELRAGAPPTPAVQSLLEQLLRSGEDDITLGALVNAKAIAANFAAFEKLAVASGDPWFRIYAAQQLADLQQKRGDFDGARATLERARGICGERRQPAYRCMELELDLSHLYAQFIEPDDAWRYARAGWELARSSNTRPRERQLLEALSNAARLHNALPVARAFLGEALERSRGEPDHENWIHVNLADLSVYALDFDQARAEIDRALAARDTLTLNG